MFQKLIYFYIYYIMTTKSLDNLSATHLIEMRDELTPLVQKFLNTCETLSLDKEIPKESHPMVVPNIFGNLKFREMYNQSWIFDSNKDTTWDARNLQERESIQKSAKARTSTLEELANMDLVTFSWIDKLSDDFLNGSFLEGMTTPYIYPDGTTKIVTIKNTWDFLRIQKETVNNYFSRKLTSTQEIMWLFDPPIPPTTDWLEFLRNLNPELFPPKLEILLKSQPIWANQEKWVLDNEQYKHCDQVCFLPKYNMIGSLWDVFPVWEYGTHFARKLWVATQRMFEMLDRVDAIDALLMKIPERAHAMIQRTARWMDRDEMPYYENVFKKQMAEAIISLTQTIAQLTAKELPWYENPNNLLQDLIFTVDGKFQKFWTVINQMALFTPPATIIWPASRYWLVFNDLVEIDKDTWKPRITKNARQYMKDEARKVREQHNENSKMPSSGRWCPVAFLVEWAQKSAVQELAEFFWRVFEQTKI